MDNLTVTPTPAPNDSRPLFTYIDSKDYDFVGAISEIDKYCFKNRIPEKLAAGIRSVLEELCLTILLPELAEPKIDVVTEYSEKHESAYVTVSYPGSFKPSSTEELLALRTLGAYSGSHEYEYDEASDTSVVKIRIFAN
jgi:hypothetical protein